ncbi:MAG: IS1595 family transposase [Acidobacteria bacterium]|nr:MAG: IS1595 family transposase [Acidobacteriota bacterium]
METPSDLRNAIVYFNDVEHCREFMVELRWPDGKVKCPRCGSEHILWIAKERVWKCYGKHDHAKFSLKTGTIFEDSPIALEKWLPAAWLIINCKNGISSYELARDLKVTQKSAWFMLHRIRLAMQSGTFEKLGGEVEADETFIGGKARNMHVAQRKRRITGTGTKDKIAVMGILERGGKIRTVVVPNRRRSALQGEIRKHVEAGAALYTDALLSYNGLEGDYAHKVVDRAVQYVDGRVHTNGLENFWSLLKRSISGTYISVEPFHLFRYLDEQSFRYNDRKSTDAERFVTAMKQIVGKRLTFDELTGKTNKLQFQTRL